MIRERNQAFGTAAHAVASTQWWTLAAASIGPFMLLLDITIVNVALPDIQKELHASLSDLQWVVDAYSLSLAALLLTAGSLADLLGRRAVFAAGVAIFTLGSLLGGLVAAFAIAASLLALITFMLRRAGQRRALAARDAPRHAASRRRH